MGGQVSKQLIEICGKPVIAHTLAAFENALTVDDIIIAVRKQDMIAVYDIISYFGVKKVKSVVCGGTTRQQSVLSGLECAGDADYIAVHDGARALVRSGQIDEVISAAYTYKAAMLGVPMKDTVKTVGKNRMTTGTADRSLMWLAQTPQAFEAGILKAAMEKAIAEHKDYTDESQLVEALGHGVYLVNGGYDNIKITTPDDIALAEQILANRG